MRLSPAERESLRAAGYEFYDWGAEAARFVASWNTPIDAAKALGKAIAEL